MAIDLVGGHLPLTLGGGAAPAVPPSDVDVVVDGVPFWLALSANAPYQRETAQFQRDQVDQQPEAGEQTLTSWWLRSQLSWHMGAGLDYLDTTSRPEDGDRQRFKTCRGVNVWTPGKVTRLNGSTLDRPLPENTRIWLESTQLAGTTYLAVIRSAGVDVLDVGANTWSSTAVAGISACASDGVNLWWATSIGIYRAPFASPLTATKVYDLPGAAPTELGWVKQRLMLGYGPAVYELSTAGPALPAPRYTHPVPAWSWSSFSDGPSGIMASGFAGLSSALFKFELATVDDVPILGPGVALLSMPAGEVILSTLYYLGSMLVLGTNRGVRVCPFQSYYGTVSLGPLCVEGYAVTSLGGYDRFIFAGTVAAGESCLMRVDLGAPLDQAGHYAWAPDLTPPTLVSGAPTAIAFREDGRKWWAVQGTGLYGEGSAPDLTQDAWLQTARIRVGTVEDKHFMYATVRGAITPASPVRVERQLATGGDWTQVFEAQSNGTRFGLRGSPCEWIALRFHLVGAGELASYQVQALPAGPRQRLISLPVFVSDFQKTRSGLTTGYNGWALARLATVERLEASGAEVSVSAPALFPDPVRGVIEKLTFVQAHDPGDRGTGTGGQLQIVLRTTS